MKGENEGSRREIKGTKVQEENKSLRVETEGADSAEGRNKMRDGENNMWRGETKEYAEK